MQHGSWLRGIGTLSFVLAAGCSTSTGPDHPVYGEYLVVVVGVGSTPVVVSQYGSAIVGYDVANPPTSIYPSAGQLVCGHETGDDVQLYLPPDSSSVFSGTYKDAMTFSGTLTTSTGVQSAVLYGPVYDPTFIDATSGTPPVPWVPSHC